MADVVAFAQVLWDMAQDDATLLTTLKTERASLVASVYGGTTTGDVVQGNKNGVSYTLRPNYTVQDRLLGLDYAIKHIEADIRPSRNRRAIFT